MNGKNFFWKLNAKIVFVFKTDSDKMPPASILFFLYDLRPLLLVLATNKFDIIINGIKQKLTTVNLQS